MNDSSPGPRPRMARASLFIPLGVFLVVITIFWLGFSLGDPDQLPSALIDDPLPTFELARLDQPDQKVGTAEMLGEPFLLNVWATWCPTCRAEHAFLEQVAETHDVSIYGINYKDDPAAAREWLQRYGDPYQFSVIDEDGQLGVELGVYGAPETFVVDAEGVIRYKRVGAVDQRVWDRQLQPVLESLGWQPAAAES